MHDRSDGTRLPHCNALQRTVTHCNTLQHTATLCNTARSDRRDSADTLQHSATHCNTLQHTATLAPKLCNTLLPCNAVYTAPLDLIPIIGGPFDDPFLFHSNLFWTTVFLIQLSCWVRSLLRWRDGKKKKKERDNFVFVFIIHLYFSFSMFTFDNIFERMLLIHLYIHTYIYTYIYILIYIYI